MDIKVKTMPRHKRSKNPATANTSISNPQKTLHEAFKTAVEQMLQGELDAHLGYSRSFQGAKQTADRRNGYSLKTVKTRLGEIVIKMPRDRDGSFEPKLLGTYRTDLCGVDDKICSLYSMGRSPAAIAKTISEIYHGNSNQELVSCITARLAPVIHKWRARRLEPAYAVAYADRLVSMNSQAAVRPDSEHAVYVIIGITMKGKKDVLGLWTAPTETESNCLDMLNSFKECGVKDILFMCLDGISGLEENVKTVFPDTVAHHFSAHLMKNSLELVPCRAYKAFCDSVKAVCNAADKETALKNFSRFKELLGSKYPDAVKCWEDNLDRVISAV